MSRKIIVLFILTLFLLLSACQPATAPPTEPPTLTPTATVTPLPTPTATSTSQPTPTPTAIPTATPIPQADVTIYVVAADETPLDAATVLLSNPLLEISQEAVTDETGQALFTGLDLATYTVTVTAAGYLEQTITMLAESTMMSITVSLQSRPVAARPTADPTTSAPAATAPPPPPPPAQAPVAGNMLANPGFEERDAHWRSSSDLIPYLRIHHASQFTPFVHSGDYSTFLTYQYENVIQVVHNTTPGTTYRLGAWVRLWSNPSGDRNISQNPPNIYGNACINVIGHTNFRDTNRVCGGQAQRFDEWQYITVDAVAQADHITVMLVAMGQGAQDYQIFWDDMSLTVSPVALPMPTPTPVPTAYAPPSRPAPVDFSGVGLRDAMLQSRTNIEQLGGVLDRVYNGDVGSCEEFNGYYQQLYASPTYANVAGDWQGLYNDYDWAVMHTLQDNGGIFEMCTRGGGSLSYFNFTVSRAAINSSLERLTPAINAANAMLGAP